jgi:hypothetical protein
MMSCKVDRNASHLLKINLRERKSFLLRSTPGSPSCFGEERELLEFLSPASLSVQEMSVDKDNEKDRDTLTLIPKSEHTLTHLSHPHFFDEGSLGLYYSKENQLLFVSTPESPLAVYLNIDHWKTIQQHVCVLEGHVSCMSPDWMVSAEDVLNHGHYPYMSEIHFFDMKRRKPSAYFVTVSPAIFRSSLGIYGDFLLLVRKDSQRVELNVFSLVTARVVRTILLDFILSRSEYMEYLSLEIVNEKTIAIYDSHTIFFVELCRDDNKPE